ncbi:prmt9 [Symbiodinium sp. CCMP2592]|nr:prmt9 [Symbiodinium sp. CCMP2592]
MARGLKKPPKRRRLGRPSRTATSQEQQNAGLASKDSPTVDAATGSWAAEAVGHARILLGERPPEHGVPEAAAMLSAVLLRLPDLWSELAQDTLLAFGTTSTANDVSGSARSRSGGSAFVAGREDLAARSRRLLLSAVASAVCPVRGKAAKVARSAQAGNSTPLAAAASSVTLQCLLGEAEADEGKFIAAFQSLRRAEALAKQAGDVNGASRAEAALDGLRAAALQRWHFQMINDVPRGEQYGRAIASAVAQLAGRPEVRARGGVTALDIGTGTGLLALMCAQQQGVQKVHACEMNEALCAIAREVIASQTTTHCPITLHPNVSTALSLEDRVDLVFCEVFDAGLLGEHALPTILHARQALLREGGLLIPACAQLFGQLVEAPKLLERFAVLHSPTGASLKGARLRNSERYSCETMSTIPHVKLTDPIPLVKLDFQEIEYLYSNLGNWIDPPVELRATCAGIAQFLVYWWEIVLDTEGRCRINTAPEGGCESWEQAVRPLAGWDTDECLRVTDGELLHLHLRMQATVKGKDLLLKTDVGAAHILDANVGLGINYAVMAWHWTMVLVFMVIYFGIAALTTPMHEGIPWLTLVQKLLVFWNMWEALGLGVISGPMHAKVNPPFQDWWYRWTVGTMKYNAPFLPCLPNRRNYLDVLVEGVLMYMLTVRVLVSPEVTPALMWIYEFLFDYGQHMHTYGTQTMYCFFCMCFTVEQGQVAGLQLFMTWFYLCSGWCKIGPWFKYLNVSNLWSAKYMVSMPWSDWYRRVMYKGYKDSDPDYHLTRAATVFSAACAVSETLGPMLVLSNSDSVVTFGIIFICCMHLYIISTLIVDVFTWNFVDALLYIFLFGCYGPAVGGPMGLQWHDVPKIHPAMAAFLLAHALYSVYGNFVPSHVPYVVAHRHAAGNFAQGVLLVRISAAAKLGKVVAHNGCPVVKGAPAPGWIGEWLGFHLLMAYFWFWNLPNRMLLPLTFDQLQAFGGREVAASTTPPHCLACLPCLPSCVYIDG